MNKPLVSVCMITYNHEKFIAEAIEGVLMQEVDFELEFIIANDCSADHTGEIVQSYIESHPRGHWIKYTRHDQNKGIMANFIWTLNQCQGKFIAFCEGDDIWGDALKIQKQTNFMLENDQVVVTFHQADFINSESKHMNKSFFSFNNNRLFNTKEVLLGQFVPLFSSMFKNIKVFKNLENEVSMLVTGDILLFSLLSQYGDIYYMNSILPSLYRIHDRGNWSSRSLLEKQKGILQSLLKLNELVFKENKKFVSRKVADYSYEVGKLQSKVNRWGAIYFFLLSMRYSIGVFYWKLFFFSFVKIFWNR